MERLPNSVDSITDYFRQRLLCDGWDVRIMFSPTGVLDKDGYQSESAYLDDVYADERLIIAKGRHADVLPDSTLEEVYKDIVNRFHEDWKDGVRIFYLYTISAAIRPGHEGIGSAFGWLIRYDTR